MHNKCRVFHTNITHYYDILIKNFVQPFYHPHFSSPRAKGKFRCRDFHDLPENRDANWNIVSPASEFPVCAHIGILYFCVPFEKGSIEKSVVTLETT